MEQFGKLLFAATDDTVRLVFGESNAELIFNFVEARGFLRREDVGEKIDSFFDLLEELIGSKAAGLIKAVSLKSLCLRLRREYEEVERYFSVLDELYEAKFKLLALSLREEGSVCN